MADVLIIYSSWFNLVLSLNNVLILLFCEDKTVIWVWNIMGCGSQYGGWVTRV